MRRTSSATTASTVITTPSTANGFAASVPVPTKCTVEKAKSGSDK